MNRKRPPLELVLEGYVDQVGMRNVLLALAKICDGKAEHIATAWQDVSLAKLWARRAAGLEAKALSLMFDPD